MSDAPTEPVADLEVPTDAPSGVTPDTDAHGARDLLARWMDLGVAPIDYPVGATRALIAGYDRQAERIKALEGERDRWERIAADCARGAELYHAERDAIQAREAALRERLTDFRDGLLASYNDLRDDGTRDAAPTDDQTGEPICGELHPTIALACNRAPGHTAPHVNTKGEPICGELHPTIARACNRAPGHTPPHVNTKVVGAMW